MSKQDKQIFQNNSTMVLIIVAAAVFAISAVVIKKAYDDFGEFRQLNQHETQVLNTLQTNRENLEGLQQEADTLAEEGVTTESVVSLLPLRYHPSADLATLEQMIDLSNTQLQDLSATEETEFSAASNRLSPYQAEATVSGDYESIKDFLAAVEESAQPMIAEGVDIVSTGDSILVDITVLLHHQGGQEGMESDPSSDSSGSDQLESDNLEEDVLE